MYGGKNAVVKQPKTYGVSECLPGGKRIGGSEMGKWKSYWGGMRESCWVELSRRMWLRVLGGALYLREAIKDSG